MARAIPYSVGPNLGPTALTKSGGGAVGYAPGLGWIWSVVCEVKAAVAGPSIGATALAAATAQAIDLNVAFPALQFPLNVQCGEAYIRRTTDFAGGSITAMTAQVGDAGDPNGLVTAVDVFTGAAATASHSGTVAAAEYAMHVELAFVPLLTLSTTGDDLDQLEPGARFTVCIPIRPLHD